MRLPGIRTLLLATYLAVLLLPVAGIGILRLYESALIRQTEAELMAQAAVLSASYRATWLERAPAGALEAMPKVELQWAGSVQYGAGWIPLLPQLDLADAPILPRPADAVPPPQPADPVALAVARSLDPVVKEARRMTLAGMRILDASGVVVAATQDEDLGKSLAAQDEVAHALRGAPKAALRERDVDPADYSMISISRNTALRVFVAVPILAEGHVLGAVLVSRTPRNIVQTLYSKRYALLELAIVLLATVTALAWFTGQTVIRPTRQLAAMARRVARGEIRAVEPLHRPLMREARELSDSIVTMARKLEARADYVRELALGISHEFKTPLTGIRGGAELLRDHLGEMSEDERRRFLSNMLADTARLERLVTRILELARADAVTPQGDERCDVAAAAAEIAAEARKAGQRVAVEAMPASLPATIDRTSFDIALANLLDNARQHAGAQASVTISGRLADGVVVEVRDDGVGVSPGNAQRIFDRFFTTRRDAGGTGLGLAIAQRRVQAFGGELSLEAAEKGALFRIRLKPA
ncbi:MAG: histidine kinase [Reyranella sp.]|uniref:sensor histidine kinase n=1 Tax=Reyranella sp. TaxID=1929291 RepID=UPI001AC2C1E8|nr:ATP-binding protein [Reyranella sp.]MBN9090328.1 histidine kinase [Reyranella sp.]